MCYVVASGNNEKLICHFFPVDDIVCIEPELSSPYRFANQATRLILARGGGCDLRLVDVLARMYETVELGTHWGAAVALAIVLLH